MNDIYFTADDHFEHGNSIKFCLLKFSCIEERNEIQKDRWNKTVSKRDLIYIIGDFAWRHHNKWIQALNGRKILIIGSHDKMPLESYKNFTEVHKYLGRAINKQLIIMFHWK